MAYELQQIFSNIVTYVDVKRDTVKIKMMRLDNCGDTEAKFIKNIARSEYEEIMDRVHNHYGQGTLYNANACETFLQLSGMFEIEKWADCPPHLRPAGL